MAQDKDFDRGSHHDAYGHDQEHDHDALTGGEHEGVDPYEEPSDPWTDDQSPVDDFVDPPPEEAAEEGSGEDGYAGEGDQSEMQPKKSGGLLKAVLVVAGVLVIGAVGYFQLGIGRDGSGPVVGPVPEVVKADNALPFGNAEETVAQAPAQPGQGDILPIGEATGKGADVRPNETVDLPFAPAAPSQNVALETPSASAPSAEVAPPVAVPPAPVAVAPTENEPAQVPAANQVPQVASAPSDSAPASAEPQIAAQTPVSSQPTQLGDGKPGMQVATVPSVEDVGALKQEIEALKKTVQDMTGQLAKAQTDLAAARAESAAHAAEAVPSKRQAARTVVSRKSSQTAHAKTAQKPAAKKAAAKAPRWVLRAATPKSAWIAESGDAKELRQVKVGDTLPGLGTIRTIKNVGGAWVVQGSKGSVM